MMLFSFNFISGTYLHVPCSCLAHAQELTKRVFKTNIPKLEHCSCPGFEKKFLKDAFSKVRA